MKTKTKKPRTFWRRRRRERKRLRFDGYYATAFAAQRQIEKLILNSDETERQKLRQYLRPVNDKVIHQAVNLDKRIRGLI